MTNEVARKIFQAVGSTMPVLEAVASLHPISSVCGHVTPVFTTLT